MLNLCLFLCVFGCFTASGAFANILLIGNKTTLSFNAVPANFGRPVTESGEHGTIFLASPLDACSPLTNSITEDTINSAFVLIIKGECEFVDQVRRAQDAGFKAAIVYNDINNHMFTMRGEPTGIHIYAVFVAKSTGLKLKKYVGVKGIEVWLVQNDSTAIAIFAVSLLAILAISAAIATCFFVRRHQIRLYQYHPGGRVRESRGMSIESVKAMRTVEFTEDLDDNCTSSSCAICLSDYNVGDKIRILPCRHKFHMFCVDIWLIKRRTFCPICKRDAATVTADPPATERTPLLSSTSASVASSSLSRSSSYVSSRPMQIGRSPTSLSYTPRQSIGSYQSYRESGYQSSSQSSLDIRNGSCSYRSRGSHFNSNSFASPSPSRSSLNSIFYSNSGNGSSTYIRSSSQQAQAMLRREPAGKSPLEC